MLLKITAMFVNRKLKKGGRRGGQFRDIIACVVGKIGSSVSIVNLRKSASLYQ
jgi:hypothetical protein